MTKKEWNEKRTELELELANAVMAYDDAMHHMHAMQYETSEWVSAREEMMGQRQRWMEAVEAVKEHLQVKVA